MIEKAIRSLLLPALPGADVYVLGAVPEGKQPPYAEFFRLSSIPSHTHSGPSGLNRDLIQVSYYATTYQAALTGLGRVTSTLDGYRGTVAGVTIWSCLSDGARVQHESDTRIYQASADFLVSHT